MISIQQLESIADEFGLSKRYTGDGVHVDRRLSYISLKSPYFTESPMSGERESMIVTFIPAGDLQSPNTFICDHLTSGIDEYGDWILNHMYDNADPGDYYDTLDLSNRTTESPKPAELDEDGWRNLFRTICENVARNEDKINRRLIANSGKVLQDTINGTSVE